MIAMIIKSLELENIRSYKKEKIEFPEGVILFEGDIGSGKSTILYAIEFALFGLGDLKSTFMLRNGAKEGFVSLTMELDGKEIGFKRTLERKKTGASQKDCSIISNGSRTEFSPEEMKREVLKMLKFNENPSPKATSYIYRYAVFTPQEAMKEILELAEDARLETLRRAFGIEEYRIARNNAGLVSKEIKDRENFLSGSLEDAGAMALDKAKKSGIVSKKKADAGELSKKEGLLGLALAGQKSRMGAARAKKAEFDKLAGELPRLKESLLDKKKTYSELEKSIADASSQIAARKERIKNLESEKKPTEKSDAEISGELQLVRSKMTAISKDIGGIEKAISEARLLEETVKSAERNIAAIDKKIALLGIMEKPTDKTEEEISDEIHVLRKQADEMREKVAVMSDAAKKFEKLIHDEICPMCEQRIEPAHFLKKSGALKGELKKFEESLMEIASRELGASKTKDALIEFSRTSDARTSMAKEREMVSKNRDDAKAKLGAISAFREALSKNAAQLQKLSEDESKLLKISEEFKKYAIDQMQILELMRETDALKKRADSDAQKSGALREEISKISLECDSKTQAFEKGRLIVSEISKLEAEISLSEESHNAALRAISSLAAEIRVLEADIKILDEMLAKKELEKKEKEMLYETRIWLEEYFSGALVSIEQHVLGSINEEFNSLFQKWFGLLMEDAELSVSINDAFTPCVVQNGYEQDIRALSGGEKTSVALAYRLALNTVVKRVCSSMNDSGLIILDEPTDGFSKEQLNHLRDVFEELACKQIILVSHERELEAFSDRVFKIVKEGSVSKVLGV